MTQKFSNAARAYIASGISDSATSITVATGTGATFPEITSPDFARAVLQDTNGIEIVLITAHAAGSDSFTVTRAQESTAARAFSAGAVFGLRVTAADAASFAAKQEYLVSGTNIKTINNTSILGAGNIQIDGGVTSFNTRTGAVTLSSGDVTTALGFTPYNSTNPSGYITSSALSSYLTSATAASTYLPLVGGTLTGTVSATGLTVGSNPSSNISALNVGGYNAVGGTGYHGFLAVTNTYGSGTNPNKWFRLSAAGGIEIVNSAYSSVIFALSDAGALSSVTMDAGVITSGTIATARLGSGTANNTTYLRGDGTWAAVTGMVYPGAGVAVSTGSAWGTSLTAASANTASALVQRDASGNFSAGTITATLSGNASGLSTTNWTISETGGVLYFKYGGVNKAKLDSSGNLTVTGNITAYGTV